MLFGPENGKHKWAHLVFLNENQVIKNQYRKLEDKNIYNPRCFMSSLSEACSKTKNLLCSQTLLKQTNKPEWKFGLSDQKGFPASQRSGDFPLLLENSVCLTISVFIQSFNNAALCDEEAVKEHQKPQFRPRPWGSITKGGILPFKGWHVYSCSSPCLFPKHSVFVAPWSWFIVVSLCGCHI